ncbi:Tigger transposable element-derived protein 4 [Oopsacas minuta]|nr:Tigger transposable element-derived protein 4 [Oopsacas minuta]
MATVHKTQLSLKRKVEIAQDLSKGMTQLDAVKKYKASKGTVSRIGKEKERWVAINFETLDSAPRKGTERKRIVKVKTIDLDDKLVEYIVRARDLNAIVTGPIIQNIATMISKKLPNLDGFSASNG